MNGRDSQALGWLPPWWGLWWLIIFVVAIILIVGMLMLSRVPPVGPVSDAGPPAKAVAECDKQFSSYNPFRIQGWTAHERYLTNYPVPTSRRPLYVYVVFRKSSFSSGQSVQQSASGSNVRVTINRPSDLNHLSNLSAEADCVFAQQPSGGTSGSGSDGRWSTYCDLTRYQDEGQEQETGLLKYRVRVENASDEEVEYCFAAECDVRYPSGKRCDAPSDSDSPYSTPGYSAPGGSAPPGYSSPTASVAPTAAATSGQ
jgi:hypothetical protein